MPVGAGNDYRAIRGGGRIADLQFQPAPGHPARAGNMAAGKVGAGVHENYGGRGVGLNSSLNEGRRLQVDLFPSAGQGQGRVIVRAGGQGLAAFRPQLGTAVKGIDLLMAQLPIPGGRNAGPGPAVAGKDDGAVFDHRQFVGTLHRLAAGKPPKAGNMAGGVLGGRPYIDQIDRFPLAAFHHPLQAGQVEPPHPILSSQPVGVGFGGGLAGFRRFRQVEAIRPGFQLVAGQRPAGSAVFQAENIGAAHPLQDPGTDNAAGAAGAVDDNRSIRVQIGSQVGNAESQFAAGNAAPAGDAEPAIFLRGTGVEDDHFIPALHPPMQFGGVNFRDAVLDFDLFAKILAGNIDAPLGRVILAGPAVDAAGQHRYIGIAEVVESSGGQGGAAAVIIAQNHRHGRIRQGGR